MTVEARRGEASEGDVFFSKGFQVPCAPWSTWRGCSMFGTTRVYMCPYVYGVRFKTMSSMVKATKYIQKLCPSTNNYVQCGKSHELNLLCTYLRT